MLLIQLDPSSQRNEVPNRAGTTVSTKDLRTTFDARRGSQNRQSGLPVSGGPREARSTGQARRSHGWSNDDAPGPRRREQQDAHESARSRGSPGNPARQVVIRRTPTPGGVGSGVRQRAVTRSLVHRLGGDGCERIVLMLELEYYVFEIGNALTEDAVLPCQAVDHSRVRADRVAEKRLGHEYAFQGLGVGSCGGRLQESHAPPANIKWQRWHDAGDGAGQAGRPGRRTRSGS